MFNNINVNSDKVFDKKNGDIFTLNEFIGCCEDHSFIDYDGFAGEILLNGKIIFDDYIYPSDALEFGHQLTQLQDELGELEIVWYNR